VIEGGTIHRQGKKYTPKWFKEQKEERLSARVRKTESRPGDAQDGGKEDLGGSVQKSVRNKQIFKKRGVAGR